MCKGEVCEGEGCEGCEGGRGVSQGTTCQPTACCM